MRVLYEALFGNANRGLTSTSGGPQCPSPEDALENLMIGPNAACPALPASQRLAVGMQVRVDSVTVMSADTVPAVRSGKSACSCAGCTC
jgi:hypothetical protein